MKKLKRPKENTPCVVCGSLVFRHPSERTQATFCSLKCLKLWRKGNKFAKGQKMSAKSRANVCSQVGLKNPFYGRKHTEETKQKLRNARLNPKRIAESIQNLPKDMFGEKHWNWQGGKSFEPYSSTFNERLKNEIRRRDNYKCRICGCKAKIVHHIDYNKTNNNMENLVTVCISCHIKTNYNRSNWTLFFKGVMQNDKSTL